MTAPSLQHQLSQLSQTVQALEQQLARGEAPSLDLSEVKRTLDDLRLRLWGLMQATNAEDPQGFMERFRIRRAIELSSRIATDLRLATLNPEHKELSDLWITAVDLSRAIEHVRKPQA